MPANPFVNQSGELSNEILLNIAEILAIKLPEGTEKIIASKWVKKFFACDPKVYKHNLSLFITCLTKQMLVKPFDEAPQDMSKEWKNFDKEYSTKDINKAVVQRLYKDSFTPPYHIDISHDMKEYMAYQEIPFFGAHFYYAFSPLDSVDKWCGFNKLNVPRYLVENLWKEDVIESPIKGRYFKRPEKSAQIKISLSGTMRKAPKAKPVWQGPISEEPEQSQAEHPSMISIPITDRVKNLPPALQRRMLKAEQNRQEQIIRKQQEKIQKSAKIDQSRARFNKKGKKVVLKKQINYNFDTDSATTPQQKPKAPIKSQSPEIPEFTGPNARLERRLYFLRKSNPPPELIQTTRDMNTVSQAINTEAERLMHEGTPNLDNVERLHIAGVDIGNRVLRMMKAQQADEVQNAAANGCEAVHNVQMTMDQLNQMLNRSHKPKEDTLIRLAKIKESMAKSVIKAHNISQMMNEQEAAEDVVAVVNQMAEINETAAERIENLQPKNQAEAVLIQGLVNENRILADNLRNQSVQLEAAIKNNDPNTSSILKDTIHTIDELLEMSFTQNEMIDDNESQAVEIQQIKKQQLEEIKQRALEIENQVESSFRTAASIPLVAKHLQISNIDGEDDIIDLTKVDDDLGETISDEFIEKERLKQRRRRTLVEVDEQESLMDISGGIMEDIEKSIEVIEDHLIPELEEKIVTIRDENQREIIEHAAKNLKENVQTLQNQLDVLNEAVSSSTLVP